MSEKENYTVLAICNNCWELVREVSPDGTIIGPAEIPIPKGTLANNFLEAKICPNCGCFGHLVRRL